jgi:hypothetical protein
MPAHAEMASATQPAPARGITLLNEIAAAPVITSDAVTDAHIETRGRRVTDAELRKDPGAWGRPASGAAVGPGK